MVVDFRWKPLSSSLHLPSTRSELRCGAKIPLAVLFNRVDAFRLRTDESLLLNYAPAIKQIFPSLTKGSDQLLLMPVFARF